ncbi:hypothetical protein [Sphingomonas jatrophae]|uniref:Uncharacterized protein n=1 Tax=Sphingomonas jatrophae TaxID=1166337 RepID=A0A1I6L039_9SPHN|nr:hypothetical protein [Sphingomonas jatrophae]SFR96817.1 hypothetical protein SAMN05192580_2079 [Sphingomonas jatrophae]
MATTAQFRRLHRRVGIDRVAGLPPQFERSGDTWLFRRHGHGPAVRISDDEFQASMRAGLRAVLVHALVLPLFAWLGWLVLERLLPDGSVNALAALFGVVLSVIGLALFGSLRHYADAPGRAFAGRPQVAPARDPSDATQPGWTTIVALTFILLTAAALGTRQPAAFYIAFATASVMLGLILAVRRLRFDAALTVVQRERLREQRAVERQREVARLGRQPDVHWWQLPLLVLFILLQLAFLALGVIVCVGVVLGITGETSTGMSFGQFIAGFLPGLALGYVLFIPLERLCKRWTGVSAVHALDWLPPSW